jgi:hypothetical protein
MSTKLLRRTFLLTATLTFPGCGGDRSCSTLRVFGSFTRSSKQELRPNQQGPSTWIRSLSSSRAFNKRPGIRVCRSQGSFRRCVGQLKSCSVVQKRIARERARGIRSNVSKSSQDPTYRRRDYDPSESNVGRAFHSDQGAFAAIFVSCSEEQSTHPAARHAAAARVRAAWSWP